MIESPQILPITSEFNLDNIQIDEDSFAYSISVSSGIDIKLKMNKAFIFFFSSESSFFQLQLVSPSATAESRRGDLTYFAYPYDDSELVLTNQEKVKKIQVLAISIKKLHTFFRSDFGNPEAVKEFLMSFKMRKYFTVKAVSAEVTVAFHQIFNNPFSDSRLYLQGKVLEIISYFLQKPKEVTDLEQRCPFIADHLEMGKIREARDLVIKNMADPITLKNLARAVGTNEFKLKVGFKSMFGTSVYAYLTDFRLQEARKLLSDRTLNVKDVSHRIGYANPSHFISAFKKKFGVTPKRQMMES